MTRLDPRLVRTLLAGAAACCLVTVVVLVTGGFDITIRGMRLRSHNPVRPAVATVLAAALAGTGGWSRLTDACAWWWLALERYAAAAAVILSVATVAAAVMWGAFVAGGSDSYCYLNQAELLARGAVRDHEPLAADRTFPGTVWAFVPAGHMPVGSPVLSLAPICPSGYPLIMAAARLTFGRAAMFWITPLAGGAAVCLVFLLGRGLAGPAAGLLAAALTASSPTFLFQLFQPMNDVTAACLWCAALVAATNGRSDVLRAVLAGLCTAAALVVRPNLFPLAAVTGLGVVLLPSPRTIRQRITLAAAFGLACAPGPAIVLAVQRAMYGSPLASGYGDLGTLFALAHVAPNLARYPVWLIQTHTPVLAIALAAPWMLGRGVRGRALWLVAFAIATLACYLPYIVFDAWWYTRFLLPALLPLLALTAAVAATWLRRAGPPLRVAGFWLAGCTLVTISLNNAAQRDVFRVRDFEWRFRSAGEYVATLPGNAALITIHHSGSVRFYSGRSTVVWADIEPGRLDDAVAFLGKHGRKAYLMFEPWEEPQFRERFSGDRLGALGWPPLAEVDGVRIYDPADFDRQRRGETIRTLRLETRRR